MLFTKQMSIEKTGSIVENALLQIRAVENAISENAKGILASTMKEEISELIKESIIGSKKSKKTLFEQDAPEDEQPEEIGVEDEMGDFEGEEDPEAEVSVDDVDDNEVEVDDFEFDGDNEMEMPPLDMTSASPEEILKVFKAMGDEDGIIVKKELEMNVDEELENQEYNEQHGFEEQEYNEDYGMGDHEYNESYGMEEDSDFFDLDSIEVDDFGGEENEQVYEIDQAELESVVEAFKAIGIGMGKAGNGFAKSTVNHKGFKEDMADGTKSQKTGKGPKFNYGKIKHGVTETEVEEVLFC